MSYKINKRKKILYGLFLLQLGVSPLWAEGGIVNWLEGKSEVDVKVQVQPSSQPQVDKCTLISKDMKSDPENANACIFCPDGTGWTTESISADISEKWCLGTSTINGCRKTENWGKFDSTRNVCRLPLKH